MNSTALGQQRATRRPRLDLVEMVHERVGSHARSLAALIGCLLVLASGLLVMPASSTASVEVPAGAPAQAAVELVCPPAEIQAGSTFEAKFTFRGQSSGLTRWQVEFGDGHAATGSSVGVIRHTYAAPGIHVAVMSATGEGGDVVTRSCVTQWVWDSATL